MPILINEVEVEIEPSGVPATGGGPGAEVTPLLPEAADLAALMDLIDERRTRLAVD